MNRKDLLAAGAGLTLAEFPFRLASFLQASGERNHVSDRGTTRHPVLVRSALTRKSDGTDEPVTVQTMFSTEVVRSSDSDGRLPVYVFPVGEHHAYRGAPLLRKWIRDNGNHAVPGSPSASVVPVHPSDPSPTRCGDCGRKLGTFGAGPNRARCVLRDGGSN